jgi:hypothetical protein
MGRHSEATGKLAVPSVFVSGMVGHEIEIAKKSIIERRN